MAERRVLGQKIMESIVYLVFVVCWGAFLCLSRPHFPVAHKAPIVIGFYFAGIVFLAALALRVRNRRREPTDKPYSPGWLITVLSAIAQGIVIANLLYISNYNPAMQSAVFFSGLGFMVLLSVWLTFHK